MTAALLTEASSPLVITGRARFSLVESTGSLGMGALLSLSKLVKRISLEMVLL
jgi:anti-anti-sigma regulatory factor